MSDPATTAGLAKLAKTVLTLGLGPLLEPWQRKRIGVADAHNHLRMRLADAQADKHIESIRAGTKTYDPGSGELRDILQQEALSSSSHSSSPVAAETRQLLVGVHSLAEADALRKALNTAAAVEFAAEEMASNSDVPVSEEPVDDDWFTKWRKGAEEVSKEEMQRLWGKLLAKETQKPGQFGLRTLDVLRALSPTDAKLVARAMPFVINSRVLLNDIEHLGKNGLDFDSIILLEDMGIIAPVQIISGREYYWNVLPNVRGIALDFPGEMGLLLFPKEGATQVKIPTLGLTAVGRDLVRLGGFLDPPMPYIQRVADRFKETAAKVQLGRKRKNADGSYNLVSIGDL